MEIFIIVFLYLSFSDYDTNISYRKSRGLFSLLGGLQDFAIYDIFPQREILHVLF